MSDVHPTGDDYWAPPIDVLILRVADALRRAGVDMPEAELHRLAEEFVLDAARVVLDWIEGPAAAALAPAPEASGAATSVVASSVAAESEDAA